MEANHTKQIVDTASDNMSTLKDLQSKYNNELQSQQSAH
jgi:hypothetical protein